MEDEGGSSVRDQPDRRSSRPRRQGDAEQEVMDERLVQNVETELVREAMEDLENRGEGRVLEEIEILAGLRNVQEERRQEALPLSVGLVEGVGGRGAGGISRIGGKWGPGLSSPASRMAAREAPSPSLRCSNCSATPAACSGPAPLRTRRNRTSQSHGGRRNKSCATRPERSRERSLRSVPGAGGSGGVRWAQPVLKGLQSQIAATARASHRQGHRKRHRGQRFCRRTRRGSAGSESRPADGRGGRPPCRPQGQPPEPWPAPAARAYVLTGKI